MIIVKYSKIKNFTLDKIAKIFAICNTLNAFNISISLALKNSIQIAGVDMTMSQARWYLIDNTISIPL